MSEGDTYRNKLTGEIYRVTKVNENFVYLDGWSSYIVARRDSLEDDFEKVEPCHKSK